jgi:uncharacterized 2Fe-2S/4Fe-4S cluster protein (DUF4445 family)
MAALPGAIARLAINGEQLSWETVGGRPPVGLCGSGVLDAVGALLGAGLMDSSGRLLSPAEIPSLLGGRMQEIDGQRHFVIYRDAGRRITLSQEDIRQVQLAKGAVRAAMDILLERGKTAWADLGQVVVSGSFGASLRPESLQAIGVLPENVLPKTGFVREGALAGVEKFLCQQEGVTSVEKLAAVLHLVPLSGTPLFERLFLTRMDFPA